MALPLGGAESNFSSLARVGPGETEKILAWASFLSVIYMNDLIKIHLRHTFLELIGIDGVYPNEDAVSAYVAMRLNNAGVFYQEDRFGNIIAKISGAGEPIMFSTHLDIPEPAPKVRYKEEGDRVVSNGSGILGADPKTGLAILLEFLSAMQKENPASHAPIEVVLTRGEEAGLLGARNLDYAMVSAKIGLVLDEDGPVTQVVTQAPGYVRLDAEFMGKVVHPREPEKGINALQVANQALSMLPWGYSSPGVTWNVGQFQAGTARNSTPGRARLKAELRSFNTTQAAADGERIAAVFKQTAAQYGASVEVEQELEFEGYKLEPTHPLIARLNTTFQAMKLTPNYFSTFGGSDANIFNSRGIVSVPIGSGYYNAHEYTETADLQDMTVIFEFLKKFV